jgi:hypothetical protein
VVRLSRAVRRAGRTRIGIRRMEGSQSGEACGCNGHEAVAVEGCAGAERAAGMSDSVEKTSILVIPKSE